MKRIIALLLAVVMVAAMFAGCQNSDANTTTPSADESSAPSETTGDTTPADETTGGTDGEYPTLAWYLIGNSQPANYDAWKANLDQYLEEKIGVHLDVKIISYSDWDQRRSVVVSTNEPYDIIFTNFSTYKSDVALGAFADITDLLEATPDLKAVMPEEYWDAVRINGQIYGVPAYKDSSLTNFFVWDTQVAEQYVPNYKDLHTLADLTDGVAAIYEGTGDAPIGMNKDGWAVSENLYDSMSSGLPALGVSYTKGDNKVVAVFEQEDVMNDLKVLHQWYEAGYINSDAPNLDNAPVYKTLSVAQGWPYAAVKTWGPGLGASPYTGEAVTAEAVQWGSNTVLSNDTVQGSMACISASSANKEKAMELLQLVNTDSYVRDALYYGLEGDNFDYVDVNGEQRVHKNNNDWPMGAYAQGTYFNVTLEDTETYNYWNEEVRVQNENAVVSPALGFSFDTTNVAEQLSACTAIYAKYKPVLLTGAMDPETTVPQIMEEMRASGFDEIVAEAQTQLDAFLASQAG